MSKEVSLPTSVVDRKPLFGIKWARIDSLVNAILMERLENIEKKSTKQTEKLLSIQGDMKVLGDLLSKIVAKTDSTTGEFDASGDQELQDLLEKAKGLGLEYSNPSGDLKFTKFDRDNLVANLDDLKKEKQTLMNYQIKQVEHLLTERTESYKYAHSILKTISDILMKITRNIKGN